MDLLNYCLRRLNLRRSAMDNKKYVCSACGYIYDPAAGDPDNGIKPGTPFDKLPADYVCPVCGVGKDQFYEEGK